MHYFVGVIFLIILFIAIPVKYFAAIAIFLGVSAYIVKFAANIITKSEHSLSSCIKAVLYSFILAIVAIAFSLKLASSVPIIAIIAVPVILILSQAFAYSTALSLSLGSGMAVSIVVTILAWGLANIFGLSIASLVTKTFI